VPVVSTACRNRCLNVHFKANTALLFVRYESNQEGDLCGPCIHKTFIGYTIVNLLLGWWGLVSMIKTPGFILWNCGEYSDALKTMWRRRKERNDRVDEFLRKNGG
jgi:hypothetical protein